MSGGDPVVRNALRSSGAHSTVTIDDVPVNPVRADDLFFMPPFTRGRLLEWHVAKSEQIAVVTHDGFRKLAGRPAHRRSVRLGSTGVLTVWDEVQAEGASGRRVDAWWHWGVEPTAHRLTHAEGLQNDNFTIGSVQAVMLLPEESELVLTEPFPWSPRYGVIESGQRSRVHYEGTLPFRAALHLQPPS